MTRPPHPPSTPHSLMLKAAAPDAAAPHGPLTATGSMSAAHPAGARRWSTIVVRRWRRGLLLALALVGFLAVASPAAAHLDIVSTTPADGGVLKDPRAGIVLIFNRSAALSGSGLTVFDARGEAVAVTTTVSVDNTTWRVLPKATLPPGRYGLRWQVVAGDAHPKIGTITFSVGPASAAPAAGTAAGTARPSPTAPGTPGQGATPMEHGTNHDPAAKAGQDHAGMGHDPSGTDTALRAALDAGNDSSVIPWEPLAAAARWASFAGIMVAVGALVVVVTTLVGSQGDVQLSQRIVRTAAAAAAAGAVVEGVALLGTVGPGVPWQPATAVAMRLLAALTLASTLRLLPRSGGGRRSHDVAVLPGEPTGGRRRQRDLPTAGFFDDDTSRETGFGTSTATLTAQLVLPAPVRTGRVRGVPASPGVAIVSCVLLLASFTLDGHTAVVGPWPIIAAAALAHTAAAAVWVGGVVLLAILLLVRARAGVPTGAGELAVRFSIPATAAVVVAGGAGLALTALIIDSPAELLTTPWGRVLLVKLGLVAVVALMGYANNRYALPALDAWRPGTARLLRRTVAAEATVMVAVLLTTALLVASQA